MPSRDALPPLPHRRTVEEAIAQADAKERIRTAQGVRAAGLTCFIVGVAALARPSTWRASRQAVGVHIHGGPSFTLSFVAILGVLAVAASPVLIATGQWLLRRAVQAAGNDPITAPILKQIDV